MQLHDGTQIILPAARLLGCKPDVIRGQVPPNANLNSSNRCCGGAAASSTAARAGSAAAILSKRQEMVSGRLGCEVAATCGLSRE